MGEHKSLWTKEGKKYFSLLEKIKIFFSTTVWCSFYLRRKVFSWQFLGAAKSYKFSKFKDTYGQIQVFRKHKRISTLFSWERKMDWLSHKIFWLYHTKRYFILHCLSFEVFSKHIQNINYSQVQFTNEVFLRSILNVRTVYELANFLSIWDTSFSHHKLKIYQFDCWTAGTKDTNCLSWITFVTGDTKMKNLSVKEKFDVSKSIIAIK